MGQEQTIIDKSLSYPTQSLTIAGVFHWGIHPHNGYPVNLSVASPWRRFILEEKEERWDAPAHSLGAYKLIHPMINNVQLAHQ